MTHARLRTVLAFTAFMVALPAFSATGWKIVGWNDLGMHCTDGTDYSVFGILPPYNNIHAQLIDPNGKLVTTPTGITVTYEAVADPAGSINRSSIGKTNFWTWLPALFGVSLPPDNGLAGRAMPGAANTPQPMTWDATRGWFIAEGIPITPYDDGGAKNFYPMMRLVARDSTGVLATASVVLPVSDEMDCRSCHASGSASGAKPAAGWANDPDPLRDYKLNVLRLHDERSQSSATFAAALAAKGYRADGLYATATVGKKPILCAQCHSSNALPGLGFAGVSQFTTAIHGHHANVADPATGQTLNASTNRTSCYRCHPGSVTRCLRGAMSAAVSPDGSTAIQCQSCHGSMSDVGRVGRVGWLDEPKCQSCHTGTATTNSGALRYQTAFVSPGVPRTAADQTFASNPNVPAAGVSLFRFSTGHGNLQCEACHGSTHAEYPSTHPNDNIQIVALQGHAGTVAECTACHSTDPSTTTGGPHGMHPVGQVWVSRHQSAAEGGRAQCAVCHGADFRGTVLSRTLGARTLSAFGTKQLWKGSQIGCYTCHNGPSSDSGSSNHPAQVANANASTAAATPVSIPIVATDADHNTLTIRVINQPAHGTAGISGTTAIYTPDAGFAGSDSFTVAAWDGSIDSNLATVTVAVAAGSNAQLTVTRTGDGSGSIASNPAGILCGTTCTASFTAGTVVTLTAQPTDSSSTFGGWTGEGCFGTGSCTVTMSQARSVSAAFTKVAPVVFALTVALNGTGSGSVSSSPAGISCGSVCTASFTGGTAVTLTAQPADATSTFAGWSGGCSGTGNCTLTMSQARSVSATFNKVAPTLFSLAVTVSGTGSGRITSSPAGIDCGSSCSASFTSGAVVALNAQPADSSSVFAGWSGACAGTGACSVTMTQARSVGAVFNKVTPQTFTLSVAVTGSGRVTSSPAGIDCGSSCSASFASGAVVVLTAQPADSSSTFAGWSGACAGTGACSVTMTQARSVGAVFNKVTQQTFTLAVSLTGNGRVTSSPAGIDCGSACTAAFSQYTQVSLHAVAASGYVFTGWSGAGCEESSTCTVSMDRSRFITATFAAVRRRASR